MGVIIPRDGWVSLYYRNTKRSLFDLREDLQTWRAAWVGEWGDVASMDWDRLTRIIWEIQMDQDDPDDLEETVAIDYSYERNKRFLEIENLSDSEQKLIELLGVAFGGAVS